MARLTCARNPRQKDLRNGERVLLTGGTGGWSCGSIQRSHAFVTVHPRPCSNTSFIKETGVVVPSVLWFTRRNRCHRWPVLCNREFGRIINWNTVHAAVILINVQQGIYSIYDKGNLYYLRRSCGGIFLSAVDCYGKLTVKYIYWKSGVAYWKRAGWKVREYVFLKM